MYYIKLAIQSKRYTDSDCIPAKEQCLSTSASNGIPFPSNKLVCLEKALCILLLLQFLSLFVWITAQNYLAANWDGGRVQTCKNDTKMYYGQSTT